MVTNDITRTKRSKISPKSLLPYAGLPEGHEGYHNNKQHQQGKGNNQGMPSKDGDCGIFNSTLYSKLNTQITQKQWPSPTTCKYSMDVCIYVSINICMHVYVYMYICWYIYFRIMYICCIFVSIYEYVCTNVCI